MLTKEHALLVHGYCDDWPSDKPHQPDRFSEFQIKAAVELAKMGAVPVVVFALGNKTSEGDVVAELMTENFQQKLHEREVTDIEEIKIVLPSSLTATTTRGEIRDFLQLHHNDELQGLPLAALSIRPHTPRVERAIKRLGRGIKVVTLASESVLEHVDPGNVKAFLTHPQYSGMVRREKILNRVDAIPGGGVFLEFADKAMTSKRFEAGAVTLLGRL